MITPASQPAMSPISRNQTISMVDLLEPGGTLPEAAKRRNTAIARRDGLTEDCRTAPRRVLSGPLPACVLGGSVRGVTCLGSLGPHCARLAGALGPATRRYRGALLHCAATGPVWPASRVRARRFGQKRDLSPHPCPALRAARGSPRS